VTGYSKKLTLGVSKSLTASAVGTVRRANGVAPAGVGISGIKQGCGEWSDTHRGTAAPAAAYVSKPPFCTKFAHVKSKAQPRFAMLA
jgi:hypothetical protein